MSARAVSDPVPSAVASASPPDASVSSPPAPAPPAASPARVAIGTPYFYGDAPDPAIRLDDASLGPLAHDPPPDATHALPRVVIDVIKAAGPVKAAAIQAKARAGYWGKVIECYRPGAVKDQTLRGETTLRVTLSRGEVRKAKVTKPMPDKDVSACLAKRMVGLEMPEAKRTTTATMTIHVAPGDEPMPPAEDTVTRGPGRVDPALVARAFEEARPALLACYEASLDYAPASRGWLLVRIQVAPGGQVAEAFESRTKLPDERLARCALRVVRKLVIAPPEGGPVRLFVPIRFEPAGR